MSRASQVLHTGRSRQVVSTCHMGRFKTGRKNLQKGLKRTRGVDWTTKQETLTAGRTKTTDFWNECSVITSSYKSGDVSVLWQYFFYSDRNLEASTKTPDVVSQVHDKYDGNTWLGNTHRSTQSVPGEWPVSFHGTSKQEADGIIGGFYKVWYMITHYCYQ